MKSTFLIFLATFIFLQTGFRVNAQRADGAELTLQKTLTGIDTIRTFREFPVDKKLTSLMIEISGSVKAGKIMIMLCPPKGNNRIYDIDVTTNMEFKQTINLHKMPECIGTWKIFIDAFNAEGSYLLNMRTSLF
jgi:hypothetical protein